jgi:hypothetical protein
LSLKSGSQAYTVSDEKVGGGGEGGAEVVGAIM